MVDHRVDTGSIRGCFLDQHFIAEPAQVSDEFPGAFPDDLRVPAAGSLFPVGNAFVQQLPDEAAEAMGDGPNGLFDAQTL